MSNIALYRKYRPSGFDEVIGQEHVVQTIQNAVAQGKIAHAYLFAGPRGTGKTTIARLVAKAANCLHPSAKGEPCQKCQNCTDIAEGKAMDIVEIDAASNRGIDEIRELKEGIRSTPLALKYKVYIIDEAHQLTKEAFNALLKTLEEPPEHALFILATTSADKMPATILSRVQRFDFKKFSLEQIVQKLSIIIKAEKAKADEEALRLIAHAAEGGLRDAESMLAQVLAHSGGKITLETVQNVLGVAGFTQVADFTDILSNKDTKKAIEKLNAFQNDGGNVEELFKSLINYLRKMMLIKLDATLQEAVVPELTAEQFSRMMAQSEKFAQEDLARILETFIDAQDTMRKTSIRILPVELALFSLFTK